VEGVRGIGIEVVDIVVVIGRGVGAAKFCAGGIRVKVLVNIDVNPDGVVVMEVAGERD
jgi:hypothetical protein